MRIRFDKVDGLIKVHDKSRYLVSFDYGYCDKICDKVKYPLIEKVILQIVLIIILQESELVKFIWFFTYWKKYWVIILIKSPVKKNKNEYHYNTFLEKSSYKDKANTEYF